VSVEDGVNFAFPRDGVTANSRIIIAGSVMKEHMIVAGIQGAMTIATLHISLPHRNSLVGVIMGLRRRSP